VHRALGEATEVKTANTIGGDDSDVLRSAGPSAFRAALRIPAKAIHK
jgi:hypothetical protein